MPKIFKDEEMDTVYKAIEAGMKIKYLATTLNKTVHEIQQLYNAAQRRTWPYYQQRMQSAKKFKPKKYVELAPMKSIIERPPAVYSNSTPYGIAYSKQ